MPNLPDTLALRTREGKEVLVLSATQPSSMSVADYTWTHFGQMPPNGDWQGVVELFSYEVGRKDCLGHWIALRPILVALLVRQNCGIRESASLVETLNDKLGVVVVQGDGYDWDTTASKQASSRQEEEALDCRC